MSFSKGLKFRKFDLHVHTPASDRSKYKDTSPEDIVSAALKRGLTGIAITDHQTAEWIDKVKNAAKGKNLIVFPGVELLGTGGERGVHILIIFDVDKDTNHINQFLNKLGIYEKTGKKSSTADVTVGQIADELEKYDSSAILILAHCHSSMGVTGDIKGNTRTLIFEPRRKCLLGAEANESDFLSEDKKQNRTRVIDCFDGTDPNYHKRKLGVYQSSDAHSLEEIGSAFTYFKVDEPITIEDIRQALIDRDTRIRQSFEYKELIYPCISHLGIISGFLADQQFEFHEGLNSILGGKGSGKSLAVEFIRFALNQQPKNTELLTDHNSKLDKCLKLHGKVEVVFTDESGRNYLIKRTFNPAEDNPIEITDLSDSSKKEFQVKQLFPVLFLSQNEITKIAEDKTGASQREFIDKFFDFYKYQQEIERLNRQLCEIDNTLADVLKAHWAAQDLQKKIDTLREEIEKLNRQIKNRVFEKYSKKEKIGQAIKNQMDFIDFLRESLVSTKLEYKDLVPPSINDGETDSDPAVKRAVDATKGVIEQIVSGFEGTISVLDDKGKSVQQEYNDWQASFASVKGEYDKVIKETGGTQVILDQKRKKFINDLSKLEKELTSYKGKAQQIKVVVAKRNEVISKLDGAYKAYFDERKNRCDYFTTYSLGTLNVTIKEQEDKTCFKENLLNRKRGTRLKDDEIEMISQNISPKEFIDELLRYEWSVRTKKDPLGKIAEKTGIKLDNVEKLAQHLLDEYGYKEILGLLYTSIPKDVPTISYKVGSGYKRLDELSVGQKAVALLIIALSDGSFPIVIDQPEDSLDLRSIWEDLCKKLRGSKEKRQFIFTTHNSSVAVASDTDKFTILQADANNGRVLYSGSINRPGIKKEVIDYLEGGEKTFDQKRRKYNL